MRRGRQILPVGVEALQREFKAIVTDKARQKHQNEDGRVVEAKALMAGPRSGTLWNERKRVTGLLVPRSREAIRIERLRIRENRRIAIVQPQRQVDRPSLGYTEAAEVES